MFIEVTPDDALATAVGATQITTPTTLGPDNTIRIRASRILLMKYVEDSTEASGDRVKRTGTWIKFTDSEGVLVVEELPDSISSDAQRAILGDVS